MFVQNNSLKNNLEFFSACSLFNRRFRVCFFSQAQIKAINKYSMKSLIYAIFRILLFF